MSATRQKRRNIAWIITYGDMVTLLLTFFVLLFVIMKEAENNVYRVINQILSITENQINDYILNDLAARDIRIERGTKGVHLTISSGALFKSGEAVIKNDLMPLLDQIGEAVSQVQYISEESDPRFAKFFAAIEKRGLKFQIEIRVEGHTDNDPINTPEFPSNWELSSSRALNVVKHISSGSGIPEKNFSALGYGEYRPIFPNDSRSHKAAHRRVEIFNDADVVESVL